MGAIKGLELLASESLQMGNKIHNECSMLKQSMQDLEALVSTHVKEVRFNHESKVKKRNVVHEKLEQEVNVGEDNTSQTETTFTFGSERLDTESCKKSRSMGDLSDRLKKLSDELGTDTCLGGINETRRGLQSFEGGLTQHLEGLKLSADVERSKRTVAHNRLEKKLNETKSKIRREQEIQARIHFDDKLEHEIQACIDLVQRFKHEPLDRSTGQKNALDKLAE